MFYFKKNFRSTSKKDVDLFFYFNNKKTIHMQIIDIEERDYNNHIKKIML